MWRTAPFDGSWASMSLRDETSDMAADPDTGTRGRPGFSRRGLPMGTAGRRSADVVPLIALHEFADEFFKRLGMKPANG